MGRLTDREREILGLIADGLQNKEIALRLRVSVKTIEFHKTQIYRRLAVPGPIGAVRWAIREGLIAA